MAKTHTITLRIPLPSKESRAKLDRALWGLEYIGGHVRVLQAARMAGFWEKKPKEPTSFDGQLKKIMALSGPGETTANTTANESQSGPVVQSCSGDSDNGLGST